MEHKNISSLTDLKQAIEGHETAYLLFYKQGAAQSDCALKNLENLKSKKPLPLFSVNVAKVKDVHPEFNITTAPVIIELKNGEAVRQLKGCHQEGALESFFSPPSGASASTGSKSGKQVVVYTTPTCSWCRTLKDYLTNNGIKFREIDVSRDEKAAADMVKRSGQQGVPQSLINGQVVVGFDRNKINSLLEIHSQTN